MKRKQETVFKLWFLVLVFVGIGSICQAQDHHDMHGAGAAPDMQKMMDAAKQMGINPTEADIQSTHNALAGVARLGPNWNEEVLQKTLGLYAFANDAFADMPEPVRHVGGLPSGVDLSLFLPSDPFSEPGTVGVTVFDSSKSHMDGSAFDRLGRLYVVNGSIGITLDIGADAMLNGDPSARLGQALDWIAGNIGDYGGDPKTIVMMVTSDVAAPAAEYLFRGDLHAGAGPVPALVMLASGDYAGSMGSLETLIRQYDGTTPKLVLWTGQYDTTDIKENNAALHQVLCNKLPACPEFKEQEGQNRISHVLSLGTADPRGLVSLVISYHTIR